MGDGKTLVRRTPVSGRPYTLLVALANPAYGEQLMRAAIDRGAARDGQIGVVSVVHKHVTSPFLLFSADRIRREFAADQQAVLDEAVALAGGSPVPVRRSLLVGSAVSGTLLSKAEETDADALLLGWQERSRPSDIVFGTTVAPWCDGRPATSSSSASARPPTGWTRSCCRPTAVHTRSGRQISRARSRGPTP